MRYLLGALDPRYLRMSPRCSDASQSRSQPCDLSQIDSANSSQQGTLKKAAVWGLSLVSLKIPPALCMFSCSLLYTYDAADE